MATRVTADHLATARAHRVHERIDLDAFVAAIATMDAGQALAYAVAVGYALGREDEAAGAHPDDD